MKKHPRTAFGILEDGQTIKLAYLVRDAYQVYLMDLHRIDLDRPLYGQQAGYKEVQPAPMEISGSADNEISIDDFDSQYGQGAQINPWDKLFNSVFLDRGVIALNVNEDQIIRENGHPANKKEERDVLRTHLAPKLIKAGEWQTSRVNLAGKPQFWLHIGVNRLLDTLKFQAKHIHNRLYFQLADANDIALSDYFRIYHLTDVKRVLLVYLGMEYRKAFLFDNGDLIGIYPLTINEDLPEPELILNRVSLALDNAQQAEPETTVICGDLASEFIVSYFEQHGPGKTSLLTFPLLIPDATKSEAYDPVYLAQFVLPIALSYKALNLDESRFTPSNFLPKYIIEAQKPFKIVWHGFLLLFILFFITFYGTFSYLALHQQNTIAKKEKRKLEHQLATLRADSQQVLRMRAEMAQFSQNLDAVRLLLVGKNPWTEVLDILDRVFQAKPISWLTNMKMESGKLLLTGITTNRGHVIDFAEALPNSRIRKVTNSKIHNNSVWNFEIIADLPQVDWVGRIEAEMSELLEQNRLVSERQAAEEQEQVQEYTEVPLAPQPAEAKPVTKTVTKTVTKPAAKPTTTKTTKTETAKKEVTSLQPITSKYMPRMTDWQKQASGSVRADYDAFVTAINTGNYTQTKELGYRYLDKYEGGRLIPMVRWHLSNQLYNNGDYTNAIEVLDPIVHYVDVHYPYGVLLAARIDVARHKTRHSKLYQELLTKYPNHPLRGLVDADLAILGKGGAQ